MSNIVVLALVGLVAQLIDGSLGMAYGATSTSLLLVTGLSPVAASASVHLAEVGTTLASGAAHWRFGNVDWPLVLRLGVPGAIGAFAGAHLLAGLSTAAAAPVTATILLVIGVVLLSRFVQRDGASGPTERRVPTRMVAPLGLVAGLVDATGGGGWGPVATPSLLLTDRLPPRKVIGTVDTSEFLVSAAASVGFLLALGREVVSLPVVLALLGGGLVAAPIAAWLVRRVQPHLLGVSVGGLLVLTNARTLLTAAGAPGPVRATALVAVLVVWVAAVGAAHRRHRRAGLALVSAP
ncbi:sulfite exporter TauE/SafE family protein [Euzebya rosea]|uniref:sulfite exporter TauE/SafE family protein n=1 Tax=Euzebya rosea TaxID=2052804 RepID=UPI000D3EA893|nr:sulfite exporter TauE/SafE family protein [Euzebya rosea]